MRASKPIQLILSLTLLLTTLAATPVQPSTQTISNRDTTEQILKRLGGRPCQPQGSEFTCVTLHVPLDHFDRNNSRKLDVVFAVRPATGRRKGMFVTATGGPGTSGLDSKDSYTEAFDANIRKQFDIVFFDQRGVGASGGLTCPAAAATFYQADNRADTPAQETALKSFAWAFAGACVNEMGSPASLPYLGTAQAVEDLEMFRQLMNDNKFWLYGESYGTQYAQTYAAAHPDHLAGLMLDGTVDLTLTGPEFLAQQAQAFNDVLVLTQQACTANPVCAADAGGDALAAYDQLVARLERAPLPYHFPLPSGRVVQRQLSLSDLELVAVGQLYNEGDRMLLQRALAASQRGDYVPLARLLYLTLNLDPETLVASADPSFSDGMYYSVECQDYGYFIGPPDGRAGRYLRAGDPVDQSVPRLSSIFYGDLPCIYWPNATQKQTRPAPLVAEGIPTLVLGATADPATPIGNGRSVAQRLANGYLITQQNGPHIIFGRGNACPDDLVTDFLVKDRVPAQRETQCEGVVADDYVALAPTTANAFASPLAAFESAETELTYLPEYYYWDGETRTSVGCPAGGGTLTFEPQGSDRIKFTLTRCAFSNGWPMTGSGSFNSQKDHFEFDVKVQNVQYLYVRDGDKKKVTVK